jgi:hypothetical protein
MAKRKKLDGQINDAPMRDLRSQFGTLIVDAALASAATVEVKSRRALRRTKIAGRGPRFA